jgi:beta-1,4-mannosyl-glycoprotein beta-1,4-N-acetylglucosaminyltransferase
VVDTFVICEANQTYMGHKKELYSRKLKGLFDKFQHKIIHIVVDLPYTHDTLKVEQNNQWYNERYQRNALQRGILFLDLDDTDLIIISDMDEIPDPDTLSMLQSGNLHITINSLEQDMYYYNLRSQFTHKWSRPKIISYIEFSNMGLSCDSIRIYSGCSAIPRGGWHLSYFGDADFIRNKLQNFSHAEHNVPDKVNINNIQWHMDNTKNIFGDSHPLVTIPISENRYLPPYYTSYLHMYI